MLVSDGLPLISTPSRLTSNSLHRCRNYSFRVVQQDHDMHRFVSSSFDPCSNKKNSQYSGCVPTSSAESLMDWNGFLLLFMSLFLMGFIIIITKTVPRPSRLLLLFPILCLPAIFVETGRFLYEHRMALGDIGKASAFVFILWFLSGFLEPPLSQTLFADETLTLSTATQALHLKRSGLLSRAAAFPLAEIIEFSAGELGDLESPPTDPHYIVVHTTSHPVTTGASSVPYDLAVTHLNQFLTEARNSELTPLPHRLFPGSERGIFRLSHSSNADPLLPSLSKFSFLELEGRSFKFTKRRRDPSKDALDIGVILFVWIFILILLMSLDTDADFSWVWGSFVIFFTCHLLFRCTPATWIFEAAEEPRSWLISCLNWFRGVNHVPVSMYKYIDVFLYRSLVLETSSRFGYRFFDSVPGSLQYEVAFSTDNGRRQLLLGFGEGEIMVLIHWLRQHFPGLFDQEEDDDENTCGR